MSIDMPIVRALQDHCDHGRWRGVAYARGEVFWFTHEAGASRRRGADGFTDVDWSGVYEARCFDGANEVRWWQEEHEHGRAARVSTPDKDHRIWNSWLLWGTATDTARDPRTRTTWVRLLEARVPSFWVPVDGTGERVMVDVLNVMATTEDGNTSVRDEVLVQLRRVDRRDVEKGART